LRDDIGEKANLAAQQPEKVRELAAAWTKWDSELQDPKWIPQRAAKKAGKKKAKR
jgi:hypothetical protein